LPSAISQGPETRIASLRKSDYIGTIGQITAIVSELVGAFNFGNNMTGQQISVCAEDIAKDYYYYSLDDLRLCFSMARKGDLVLPEKLFRLDQSVVFQFLALYDQERQKEKRKLDQQKQSDNNIYDTLGSEPVIGIIKEVADKLSIREMPAAEPRTRTTDAFSKMCHEEFDALWLNPKTRWPTFKESVRAVTYHGKAMQITEYMGHRLMEVTNGPDNE